MAVEPFTSLWSKLLTWISHKLTKFEVSFFLPFFACERFLKTINGATFGSPPFGQVVSPTRHGAKAPSLAQPTVCGLWLWPDVWKAKTSNSLSPAIRPITPAVYDRPPKAGLAGGGRASTFRITLVCPVQKLFPNHCRWFRPGRGRRGLHVPA